MKYVIAHEIPAHGDQPCRIRLRCRERFTEPQSRVIAALLETQDGVLSASASHLTGSILIYCADGFREGVLEAAGIIDESFYGDIDPDEGLEPQGSLGQSLLGMFAGIAARSMLPTGLRAAISAFRALPLIMKGVNSLFVRGELNVSVLDASAVGVSLLRRDFKTASVITTLLSVGDTLEEWTRKKSKESLAGGLALHIDKLWVKRGGEEVQIPAAELQVGDLAVVRTGCVIPVDGVVEEGDAMVDQSAMTGESEPVHRTAGVSVYAGTVVEDGELVIRVTAFDSETRIQRIADMIDESEELKAGVQSRAERLADGIVPWSFLLAGVTWLVTGSAVRASAALMVDYSCAIKLAVPLAILAAMREGAKHGMLVKGGRFLEALAEADTLVFDKTGTLTVSTPSLVKVIPFGGFERDEVLRMAACLEEHFPHSIARAVVEEAQTEGLSHSERHSSVEYLAAHGIISKLDDERLLLGSAHFIFEDNNISTTPEEDEIIAAESAHHSMLYLAVGDRLAGALCIEDPIRPDAKKTVRALHDEGISRIIMLTGDAVRTAEAVASQVGADEVRARMLPEDKTSVIKEMEEAGHGVVMVGDGINDSPALAAASVGVAMRSGADIARETADMVLINNSLGALVSARRLGTGVMRRIHTSVACIVGVNSLLIGMGLVGVISPALSALLHNLVTVGTGVYSMMPILPDDDGGDAA